MTVKLTASFKGHSDSVNCLAYAGDVLFSGSEDATARLWDLRTGKATRCLKAFGGDAVTSVCLSEVNPHMLFAAAENRVYFFDSRSPSVVLTTSDIVATVDVNEDEINQVSVNAKGTFLAAADDSGQVRIIDIKKRQAVGTLRGIHDNMCTSVLFRPKTTWEVISGGMDCRICDWDFGRRRPLFQLPSAAPEGVTSNQMVNPPFVHSLAATADGKKLVGGLGSGEMAIWDLKGRKEITRVAAHGACVCQVVCPKSGNTIVSAGNDSQVAVWRLSSLLASASVLDEPETRKGGQDGSKGEPVARQPTKKGRNKKRKGKKKGKKVEEAKKDETVDETVVPDSTDTAASEEALSSDKATEEAKSDQTKNGPTNDEATPEAILRFHLPQKPNWMNAKESGSDLNLYVCDTTPVIAAYRIEGY